jgi:hypothetical protein
MVKQSHEEWKAEAIQRFGENPDNWAFVCPACGHVATISNFKFLGEAADSAAQQCIGRVNSRGMKPADAKSNEYGCDWAAFGLFGTLGKGRTVEFPDGTTIEVFDFAEVK